MNFFTHQHVYFNKILRLFMQLSIKVVHFTNISLKSRNIKDGGAVKRKKEDVMQRIGKN